MKNKVTPASIVVQSAALNNEMEETQESLEKAHAVLDELLKDIEKESN